MKRNAQSSVFVLWTGGILVCLLAVLLALVLSSCGSGENVPITTEPQAGESAAPSESGNPAVDPGTVTTEEPGTTETAAPTTILGETADAGQAYIDKLTFLGDSTTYGLWYYNVLTGGRETNQVWTPKSGTLALFNYATATGSPYAGIYVAGISDCPGAEAFRPSGRGSDCACCASGIY